MVVADQRASGPGGRGDRRALVLFSLADGEHVQIDEECRLATREFWLQHDGRRILTKLMVAFGACASIWALERKRDAESEGFKQLLMHLSGRQTKRDRRITTSGMLAGLWVFQAALGPLAQHGPEQLNAMLENHLPLFALKR